MKGAIARVTNPAVGVLLTVGLSACNQQAQLTFSLNASPTPTAIQQPSPAPSSVTLTAPTATHTGGWQRP